MNEKTVKSKSKAYFDTIAKDYDQSYDGKFVTCLYEEIITRVMDRNPENILDLGCGNGNVMAVLAQNTKARLYGIDLSQQMVLEASKRLEDKAEIVQGDAENLPYQEQQFDVIICNASFHHYPNPEVVLSEIHRVLKKNGTLILGDPTAPFIWYLKLLNKAIQYSNSGDYHIYHEKEITELLKSTGFQPSKWKKIGLRTFVINAKKY